MDVCVVNFSVHAGHCILTLEFVCVPPGFVDAPRHMCTLPEMYKHMRQTTQSERACGDNLAKLLSGVWAH